MNLRSYNKLSACKLSRHQHAVNLFTNIFIWQTFINNCDWFFLSKILLLHSQHKAWNTQSNICNQDISAAANTWQIIELPVVMLSHFMFCLSVGLNTMASAKKSTTFYIVTRYKKLKCHLMQIEFFLWKIQFTSLMTILTFHFLLLQSKCWKYVAPCTGHLFIAGFDKHRQVYITKQ